MEERTRSTSRRKTRQQLIKEILAIAATTALCTGLGVILVVLGCTGVVSETNSSRIFMLVAGIIAIIISLTIVPTSFYLTNWQYFNKSKFERKCNELVQFEEKIYKEAVERILPLKRLLEPMGLDLHVLLLWYDFFTFYNLEETETRAFVLSRIEFNTGYHCLLQCAVTEKGEDPMNDEIFYFDRVFAITSIGGAIARFNTYAVSEDYYKDFEECCKKIQEIGYENFIDTLVDVR